MVSAACTTSSTRGVRSLRCGQLIPREETLSRVEMRLVEGGGIWIKLAEGFGWYVLGKVLDYAQDHVKDIPAPEVGPPLPEDPIQSPMGYTTNHIGQPIYY